MQKAKATHGMVRYAHTTLNTLRLTDFAQFAWQFTSSRPLGMLEWTTWAAAWR